MSVSSIGSVGPLSTLLLDVVDTWSRSQHQLVVAAADFADSGEWAAAGSPTAAHWLAAVADVEVSTAREWVRIGRQLRTLPATAAAFETRYISYSKVRTLTRLATADNETQLLDIAFGVPAGDLNRALAAWTGQHSNPTQLEAHHRRQRSIKWRCEPDGMVTFTLRLPPLLAGMLISFLTTWVMKCRQPAVSNVVDASADVSTVAQQHVDALQALLTGRTSTDAGARVVASELVLHIRGDGVTLDDGTPIPDTVAERIAPESFLRVMIHDAERRPVNVSSRRRHPSTRQKRLVKERDRVCADCGREDLLEYDHVPPYQQTRYTTIDELQLRCAPCHHKRHAA